MPVGTQSNNATIDNTLTSLALQLRNLMQAIQNLSMQVNGTAQGLAYLESIGYSSAPDTDNPGSQSDAEWALQVLAYMNIPAGVYFGTVQAGGTDGSNAVAFDCNQALASLWNGQ